MFDDNNLHRRRWPDGSPIGAVPDSPEQLDSLADERDSVPWNRFDTFLRRAFMIGLVLLVWFGMCVAVTWSVDRMLTPPAPSDVYPSDAPSLLACDPEDADC